MSAPTMNDYSYSWPVTATIFAVEKEQTVAELTRSRNEWPISGDHMARYRFPAPVPASAHAANGGAR